MSFKRLLVVVTVALAVTGAVRLLAQAQGGSGQEPSLGDLARQQRALREKAAKKPAKEFSNDNLPARPAAGGLTVAAEMSTEAQGEGKKTEEAASTEGTPSGTATTTEPSKPTKVGQAEEPPAHDEAYYRDAMGKLRDRLAMHQRQLSVLEQKLSQGEMQYYADPQKALEQSSTPSVNADTNKLRDDIEKKKQDIADDEKAMEDLRDQLRSEGGPPSWLR